MNQSFEVESSRARAQLAVTPPHYAALGDPDALKECAVLPLLEETAARDSTSPSITLGRTSSIRIQRLDATTSRLSAS